MKKYIESLKNLNWFHTALDLLPVSRENWFLSYMEDPGCLCLRTIINRSHMATQSRSKTGFSSEGVFQVATRTQSVDVVQNYRDTADYYWLVVMVNDTLFPYTPIAFNHLHSSQYRYWAHISGRLCVHAMFDCIHCTSIICISMSLLWTVCLYLRCAIIDLVTLFFCFSSICNS